jgi:alkanesulfonate monooxygenase SsuD/methylene tetrahydromethanopterin reductase-like flavin-dependent oxidoreductase (luciferase family)
LEFGIFDWVEASDTLTPAQVYAHKLELAEAADKAGFHCYFLAEHQGTPLSINGAPGVLLSAMIQRTRQLRLGALTFCLPWTTPYRFYSEICMLDQLSGGRLELGVGRGVSPIEARIFQIKDIEEARERYRETLEIFFAACRTSSLSHKGRYYQYDKVELYTKPVQLPYPPLWFPSSNNESVEFTARHGYSTVLNRTTAEARTLFQRYREVWEQQRHDPGRHNGHITAPKLAKTQHIVLADTDSEAEELGVAAYETWKSHMHHLTRKHSLPDVMKLDPFAADSVQKLVCGSPKTVLQQLQEIVRETGQNYLMAIFSFGSLPPQAAMRSMQLFSEQVMPKLKAA